MDDTEHDTPSDNLQYPHVIACRLTSEQFDKFEEHYLVWQSNRKEAKETHTISEYLRGLVCEINHAKRTKTPEERELDELFSQPNRLERAKEVWAAQGDGIARLFFRKSKFLARCYKCNLVIEVGDPLFVRKPLTGKQVSFCIGCGDEQDKHSIYFREYLNAEAHKHGWE